MNTPEPMPHEAVKRALGAELRRARETLGWTRADLAERLPTKTQDHVLYTYEQGIAHRHAKPEEIFQKGIMASVVV